MPNRLQKNASSVLDKMPPKYRTAMQSMTPVQAMLFLGEWLKANGVLSPQLFIQDEGVPQGAEAVTRVNPKDPSQGRIIIRPDAIKPNGSTYQQLPNGMSSEQNLLAHEGVHYLDVYDRGTSDHGRKFENLARRLGVITKAPRRMGK